MKSKYITGAVLAAVIVAAGTYFYGGSQAPAGQPPLRDITAGGVAEIKNQFNAAKGEVRVLLLLSPT